MCSRTWLLGMLVSRRGASGERWWRGASPRVSGPDGCGWHKQCSPHRYVRRAGLGHRRLGAQVITGHPAHSVVGSLSCLGRGQSTLPPHPFLVLVRSSVSLLDLSRVCLSSSSLSPIRFTAHPAPLAPAMAPACPTLSPRASPRSTQPAARASSPLAYGTLSSPYARDYREPHHLVGL